MRPTGRGHGVIEVLGIGVALLAFAACSPVGPGEPGGSSVAPSTPDAQPSIVAIETPPGSGPDAGLPTLLPNAVLNRVPTRVRIRELGIDLPVVAPPGGPGHFPYCNVAEYLPTLSRPGRPGATFIYAHARPGMFLPLLEGSLVNGGRPLLGLEVDVFTSDRRRFTYEVTDVNRHVTSLETAYLATAEQLMLQTSEGPVKTPGKTVLIAEPRGETEVTVKESQPTANPVRCE